MTVKETADRAGTYASDKLHAVGDKLHDAGASLRDAASAATSSAGETLGAVREKVADAYDSTRDRTGVALDSVREKASNAYATTRERAAVARDRAGEGLDESPLAAIIGGIAVGVLIGALLPRGQRETELLTPVGGKLAALARDALSAAKEAGAGKLDELGLTKDGAREQVNKLVESAGEVASTAGSAAAGAVRQSQS